MWPVYLSDPLKEVWLPCFVRLRERGVAYVLVNHNKEGVFSVHVSLSRGGVACFLVDYNEEGVVSVLASLGEAGVAFFTNQH